MRILKIGIVGDNAGNTHYLMGKLLQKKGYEVIQFSDALSSSSRPIWTEHPIMLPFYDKLNRPYSDSQGLESLLPIEKKIGWKDPKWFHQTQFMHCNLFDIKLQMTKILLGKNKDTIFRYLRKRFSTKKIFSSYCKFSKMLNEISNCDVVISQGWHSIIPYLLKIPYVVVPYGTEVLQATKNQDYLEPLKSAYTVCTYSGYIDVCLKNAKIENKSPFQFIFDINAYKPIKVPENSFSFQTQLENKFVFFMPARMHNLYKGTDKVIKAFSKIAKKYDNIVLIMLDWGDDKIETKKLIKNLDIEKKTIFLQHYFSDISLNMLFNLSDVVLDLLADGIFGYNSLGGLSRGAAIAGRPMITAYYHDKNSFVNIEEPPLLHAVTEEEITAKMIYCLENKDSIKQMGNELRKWTLKFHGESAVDELIKLLKNATKQ